MTKQAIAWFDGFSAVCAQMGVDPRKLLQKQAQQKATAGAQTAPQALPPAYPDSSHDLDPEWYPESSGTLKTLRESGSPDEKRLAETLTGPELSAASYGQQIGDVYPIPRFAEGSIDADPRAMDYEWIADSRFRDPNGYLNTDGTNFIKRIIANHTPNITLPEFLHAQDVTVGTGQGYNGRDLALPPGFIRTPDAPARAGTGK